MYKIINLFKQQNILSKKLLLILLFAASFFMIANILFADGTTTDTDAQSILGPACKAMNFFGSNIGILISAAAIIFVGVQLFSGRMAWTQGITIIFAIILVTKSATIVEYITGTKISDTCPDK